MRIRTQHSGLTVNAIAGTHVVFLGFDLDEAAHPGFRGFAIQRIDHAEDEKSWMRGMKTFEELEPDPAPGLTFSSWRHPFQGFQWADYAAKPGREYTYTVHRMYGELGKLKSQGSVSVDVKTEVEDDGMHSVFFNRGSIATQEYARRFGDKRPSEVGDAAYEWLSRGLIEALLRFISQAEEGDKIYGAVYEFQDEKVLDALRAAAEKGVELNLIYDDVESWKKNKKTGEMEPNGPWDKNRKKVRAAGLNAYCTPRGKGKLMHNKFFVYCDATGPREVWTGSTNLTENGIYGHSNLGHIVADADIAAAFLDYWGRLAEDPEIKNPYQSANEATCAIPDNLETGTSVIFSPRTSVDALDWYARLASEAKEALLMTFAFGMHESFQDVYRKDGGVLRIALMEKASRPFQEAVDVPRIQEIRARPNVLISIGNRIPINGFDRWLAERDRIIGTLHIHWIHTKYMLIDPLGDEPILVSGSANFSKASSIDNDENMVIIKGGKRIADIYFGEYMRLYTHYAFREAVRRAMDREEAALPEQWRPQFLSTTDEWMEDYFDDTNDDAARCLRRVYFSGSSNV